MVTHRGETYPSSENFNEQTPPDQNSQAVTERPPETESTSQYPPEIIGSYDGNPPTVPPYDGRLTGPYSMPGPGELSPQEVDAMRRRNIYTDPTETIKKRNKAIIGLIGASGIFAAIAGAYIAGRGSDAAEFADNYRPGFPPNPPAATAPEVPGQESIAGKLHGNMTPAEKQAFVHNYAKENLSQEDLNKFELISTIPTTSEFRLPGASTAAESREVLHWYNNVVLGAIGDQVVADRNALAREQGYSQISPAAVDALKNGFDPNRTPDPKLLLDVFQLHIAAATSPYITREDQIKLLDGASASPNLGFSNTVEWSKENDQMFIFDTKNIEASQVFNWNDPHILKLKPGISYEKGAPIIVVHTDYIENTKGRPESIPRQYTFRLETHEDPETGKSRIVPSAESIHRGGRVVDGGSVSYFNDLTILNK